MSALQIIGPVLSFEKKVPQKGGIYTYRFKIALTEKLHCSHQFAGQIAISGQL